MTGFEVNIKTATEKYTKLVDAAYEVKDGRGDADQLIKLIHSTFVDEVDLIYQLGVKEERKEERRDIQIPAFMCRKNK